MSTQEQNTPRREIKFRCWYKGKMIYRNGYNSFFEFSITPEGLVFVHGEPGYTNGADRNALLLQYTGLKDKNGKEIYEGDIVAVENEGDVITKCIFELGQFILVDNAGGIWARQLYHQPHRLTIVGNIYENSGHE